MFCRELEETVGHLFGSELGAGGIAQAHLNALEAIGGVDVIAVADVSMDVAKRTAERWSIPV